MRRLPLANLLISAIIAVTLAASHTPVARAQGSYAPAARAKFQQKNYDEAIDLYRKHLRRAPGDYSAWNQLGAAYFHTGQPKRALKYLKQVERKTIEKSYNYYYQGLCYQAAGGIGKAKEYFAYAATRFTDEYGSRSTFEMGAIEYNAKNKPRAHYWLTMYLQRYPAGVYRVQAGRLLESMQRDEFITDVRGTEKPDMETALYRYNKLSLAPYPHYWFLQGGTEFTQSSGNEPIPGGGIKANNKQEMAAIANAGIGIGPWREKDMTAFGGYTYRQRWLTDEDRISTFFDEPTDFEYFPLRGDFLERRHQFYGDFRRDALNKMLYFGVFGRYELARIGSSFFPGPDAAELRKVLKISDTTLIIPWIGATYAENMRTLVYLYMRKELNDDSPEHSNKTYELGLKGGNPVMSYGLSHEMDFPEQSLTLNIELFQYEFIYNDYWLDYKRLGGIVSAEIEVLSRWYVSGAFGYYQDTYVLPRLKQRACNAAPPQQPTEPTGFGMTQTEGSPQPTPCLRDDTGMLMQAGLYWNWTQFQRLSGFIQNVDNKNATQKEFQESQLTFNFAYTMAFPSVKRVSRAVDRYADSAFTKDAE